MKKTTRAKAGPKQYTIVQASKRLKITPEAVLKAIRAGRMKARLRKVKVPKYLWMIAAESVEKYTVSMSHRLRGLKNA